MSEGGKRAWRNAQLEKCQVELQNDQKVFGYDNAKEWFEKNGNKVPWKIHNHQGRDRFRERIKALKLKLKYKYQYEPFDESKHGISFSNFILSA